MLKRLLPVLCLVSVLAAPRGYGDGNCDLEEMFRSLEPEFTEEAIAQVAPADGGDLAWGTSQVHLAYILMYLATDNTDYLDRFIRIGDRIWSVRADKIGSYDVIREATPASWTCTAYSAGKPTIHDVHTGMITYPMALFVRQVYERPELEAYRAKADEYLGLLRESIATYDKQWRNGPFEDEGTYYLEGTDQMTSINRVHSVGRTDLMMARITGEPEFLDRVERAARYLKRRWTWHPEGWLDWGHFMPDPLGRPPWDEDISHAGATVDFVALCAQEGIVFTPEDVAGLVKTLTDVVMLEDGTFASTVAGNVWDQRWDVVSALRWGRLLQFDAGAVPRLKELACVRASRGGRPWPGIPYLILAEKKG